MRRGHDSTGIGLINEKLVQAVQDVQTVPIVLREKLRERSCSRTASSDLISETSLTPSCILSRGVDEKEVGRLHSGYSGR